MKRKNVIEVAGCVWLLCRNMVALRLPYSSIQTQQDWSLVDENRRIYGGLWGGGGLYRYSSLIRLEDVQPRPDAVCLCGITTTKE